MKLKFLCPLAGILLLGSMTANADATKKAALPLVIYSESGGKMPFIPSGYMGNTGAIKMNDHCTVQPHSGKTCLQIDYTAKDNWGGVVWQNPANNWGAAPGGWNLSGAKTLSFWARGAKGTEVVTFVYGLVGKGKPNADTSTGKMEVHLTKAWKQYTIPLAGKNMSHIITGFAWTLGATGSPETFYLDDIRYS
jgi:hypothetical protein